MIRALTLAALLAVPAVAATCERCHREQAQTQPSTVMARALEPVENCAILRDHPRLTFQQGPYSYSIVRAGDASLYTVTDGRQTLSAPIRWAFGRGAAGQTYVLEIESRWYESRVSFYREIGALDLTMGASNNAPKNLLDAAGRQMSGKEVLDCFGCHSSGGVHASQIHFDQLVPGVHCQNCHGPTAAHLAGVQAGDPKAAAMRKLSSLTSEEISDLCGTCHRTWAQIAASGPRGILNVRFQPYRLANSKCYDAVDRRIACVACHDPHRDLVRNAAAYDSKCLACHAKCPTGKSECVTCHMPKYELPGAHNKFTDHHIRIVRAHAPYPN